MEQNQEVTVAEEKRSLVEVKGANLSDVVEGLNRLGTTHEIDHHPSSDQESRRLKGRRRGDVMDAMLKHRAQAPTTGLGGTSAEDLLRLKGKDGQAQKPSKKSPSSLSPSSCIRSSSL